MALTKFTSSRQGSSITDPTAFMQGVCAWAAINLVTLAFSGPDLFSRPLYSVISASGLPRWMVTSIVAGDFVVLACACKFRSVSLRASAAIASATLWLLYGLCLLAGSWRIDLVSTNGLWCMVCALGCFNAASQWVFMGHSE